MSKARHRLVENVVADLQRRFPALCSPPVRLEPLLAALNIELVEKDFGLTMSGAAIVDGTRRLVSVNSIELPARRRFTIAHELGHILLHQDQALSVDVKPIRLMRDKTSAAGESWREIEANFFAAILLMPKLSLQEEFAKESEANDLEDDVVKNLADYFGVSLQAMSIRLSSLGMAAF